MTAAFVDIGEPPSGEISLFNAYIGLWPSFAHDTIWSLRDVKDILSTKVFYYGFEVEDERLREFNANTRP
ncbi:hypothetical protein BDV93DRAFT_566968 [Ceratobasidium sp. AG-I]|nr:hypothetical protein BDV93DRAFT_566968 [Ceratobasidium sp. AG-I]